MKYRSIYSKLVIYVTTILALSSLGSLSVVAVLNYKDSNLSLVNTENQIRSALVAKGEILVKNNAQALKGMAEDNAFTDVRELVSSTVNADTDIVFGTYMNEERQAWVKADPDNPEGTPKNHAPLEGKNDIWAANLTKPNYKETTFNRQNVYLFAAPVTLDDEVLGTIQYGLSTKAMAEAVQTAKKAATQSTLNTLGLLALICWGSVLLAFFAVRKFAQKITTPLSNLTKAANTISKGNYHTNVHAETNDELGILATSFDSMRSTILKKMNNLSSINQIGQNLATKPSVEESAAYALEQLVQHTHSEGALIIDTASETLNQASVLQSCGNTESLVANLDLSKIHDPTHFENSVLITKHPKSDIWAALTPLQQSNEVNSYIVVFNNNGKFMEEASDIDFYKSIAQILNVTIKNIQMRDEIEEYNRSLEQKVEERTLALREKANDIMSMMHNMQQGLFTITEGGKIHHEYAAHLETIFDRTDIAGSHFGELLFEHCTLNTDLQEQVISGVEAAIGGDPINFDFNQHLLIKELMIDDKYRRILELDWAPIILNDVVQKVMVTVRDVTFLRTLTEQAKEQNEELEIIGQLLSVKPTVTQEFNDYANQFTEDIDNALLDLKSLDSAKVDQLFRVIHTIKGNARIHSFTYIQGAAHELESELSKLRGDIGLLDIQKLQQQINDYKKHVDRYIHINNNILMRDENQSAGLSEENIQLLESSISMLDTLNCRDLNQEIDKVLLDVKTQLSQLTAINLPNLLSDICHTTKTLSRDLGKWEPHIHITADGVFIKPLVQNCLKDVFMHCFRNAIDHGIESAETRRSRGKPEAGNIWVEAIIENTQLKITMKDDGAGLNLANIQSKAQSEGIITEGQQLAPNALANLIFSSGLSTAENISDISGRGVGLDAAKEFLNDKGGTINVVLADANIDDFDTALAFHIEMTLPLECVVKATDSI